MAIKDVERPLRLIFWVFVGSILFQFVIRAFGVNATTKDEVAQSLEFLQLFVTTFALLQMCRLEVIRFIRKPILICFLISLVYSLDQVWNFWVENSNVFLDIISEMTPIMYCLGIILFADSMRKFSSQFDLRRATYGWRVSFWLITCIKVIPTAIISLVSFVYLISDFSIVNWLASFEIKESLAKSIANLTFLGMVAIYVFLVFVTFVHFLRTLSDTIKEIRLYEVVEKSKLQTLES